MAETSTAKFSVGDVIHHRLFEYRGAVFDVDSKFSLSDEWYEQVAKSQPPKTEPWYHVLVHGGAQTTYVAEQHLETAMGSKPVIHPLITHYFSAFENGRYVMQSPAN